MAKPGRDYIHYKGSLYRVLHVGTHTETEEEMVVYQALKDGRVWIRPLAMWEETLPDGTPRFRLVPYFFEDNE